MSGPRICKHKREIDGARCALNAEPEHEIHGYAGRVDYQPLYESMKCERDAALDRAARDKAALARVRALIDEYRAQGVEWVAEDFAYALDRGAALDGTEGGAK